MESSTPSRRPVIAGNWKMHRTVRESVELIRQLKPLVEASSHCDIVVAPPFTALWAAAREAQGSPIAVAAQDIYWESQGAFTGEISPGMVAEAGCRYAILGHSERRSLFGETSQAVSRKALAALKAGLLPIVCLGEQLSERESGRTEEVVGAQFRQSLAGLTEDALSLTMIAYEPVWAIGTGRAATPEMAQDIHAFIRDLAAEVFGRRAAEQLPILYGGSVKPENVDGLMARADIDGALVGGASLKAESFAAIVNFQV
ncbi:MAG: triose-phosphate isomerase [Acidobacteriota bacterium]|nr:triose-phosphate isomerase [Acidobacteriota bacterium]